MTKEYVAAKLAELQKKDEIGELTDDNLVGELMTVVKEFLDHIANSDMVFTSPSELKIIAQLLVGK